MNAKFQLRVKWIVCLVLWLFACLPANADPFPRIESISVSGFSNHFQTVDGHQVTFPVISVRGGVLFSPLWLLELRHSRGTSSTVNGFQASVGDFEARVDRRLDDVAAPDKDGPGQDVYAWAGWKIWTSTDYFNGNLDQERDEGLGLGISRFPSSTHTFSYGYSFGIYPSVRERVGQAVSRLSIEASPAFLITRGLQFTVGYRYWSILTDAKPRQRAQEQGISFGLRGIF